MCTALTLPLAVEAATPRTSILTIPPELLDEIFSYLDLARLTYLTFYEDGELEDRKELSHLDALLHTNSKLRRAATHYLFSRREVTLRATAGGLTSFFDKIGTTNLKAIRRLAVDTPDEDFAAVLEELDKAYGRGLDLRTLRIFVVVESTGNKIFPNYASPYILPFRPGVKAYDLCIRLKGPDFSIEHVGYSSSGGDHHYKSHFVDEKTGIITERPVVSWELPEFQYDVLDEDSLL